MQLITNINDIDPKAWSIFTKNHPNGNIFQTLEMYQLYFISEKHEPIFLALKNQNGKIIGILIAVIIKEHNGFLGQFSSRSIIHGGPLVETDNLIALNYLLSQYNKIIRNKAIYSQFRNIWNWSDNEKKVFINNGYNWEDHLDIIHDLTKSKEEIFAKIHSGRKKNIKRAEKIGLVFNEVSTEEDFSECLKLIACTYKRIKLPMPEKDFFLQSFNNLKEKGILKTFSATFNKKIIGTRLVLCYNGLIYDWYAGSDENHRDKYTNDYLPWKIFEWGCLNNYNSFDFGGAGKPNIPYGVRDYKLKFGGKLVDFGRFEIIHNRLLKRIGNVGFSFYKFIKRHGLFK